MYIPVNTCINTSILISYTCRMETAIEQCSILIMCVSDEHIRSKMGQAQLFAALNHGLHVIAVVMPNYTVWPPSLKDGCWYLHTHSLSLTHKQVFSLFEQENTRSLFLSVAVSLNVFLSLSLFLSISLLISLSLSFLSLFLSLYPFLLLARALSLSLFFFFSLSPSLSLSFSFSPYFSLSLSLFFSLSHT